MTLVVRVWRGAGGFRADARPLHGRPGDVRFFRSLGALLDHLAGLGSDPDGDPDPDLDAGPDDGTP